MLASEIMPFLSLTIGAEMMILGANMACQQVSLLHVPPWWCDIL